MDTHTACDRSGEVEADSNNMVQTRSSPDPDRLPDPVTKCQRDDESEVSDVTAESASEHASPLLQLPGELRNMVYKWALGPYDTLHQPSITRVNRQIRKEALSLYYSGDSYVVHIPRRPGHDRYEKCYCKVFGLSCFNADTLDAFGPRPDSGIWTSSLRHLSSLCLEVELPTWYWDTMPELSLHIYMSAEDQQPHRETLSQWTEPMETKGLRWDDQAQVGRAFLDAVGCCENVDYAAEEFEEGYLCREVDETESRVVPVLCLLARLCPQITAHVVVSVELEVVERDGYYTYIPGL